MFQSIVEKVKFSTQLSVGHVLFTDTVIVGCVLFQSGGKVFHTAHCGSCFVLYSNTNNGSCVLFQSIVEKVKSSTQLIVGHVLCPDSGSCFVSEYCRGGEVLDPTDCGSCFLY